MAHWQATRGLNNRSREARKWTQIRTENVKSVFGAIVFWTVFLLACMVAKNILLALIDYRPAARYAGTKLGIGAGSLPAPIRQGPLSHLAFPISQKEWKRHGER
jgi:hypothetical protein